MLGVGDAPSAIVPIAQFHPADIAASWFAVLGEILGGPVASPVFQPETETRRHGLGKIDGDRVDFARVIPHNALPVLKGNAVRRCVKGNWRLVAEERASKSERRQKGKPESGIHGLKLPDRKPWPQHSFRPAGNSVRVEWVPSQRFVDWPFWPDPKKARRRLDASQFIAIEELGQSLGHDKLANALASAIHLSLAFGHKSAALEKWPRRQADFREKARRALLPDRFFSRRT